MRAGALETLSSDERAALLTLPMPRDAQPHLRQAARSYSSLWRKSSAHWDAMLALEEKGIVERTVSRGETLWRPTKELGLAILSRIHGENT